MNGKYKQARKNCIQLMDFSLESEIVLILGSINC